MQAMIRASVFFFWFVRYLLRHVELSIFLLSIRQIFIPSRTFTSWGKNADVFCFCVYILLMNFASSLTKRKKMKCGRTDLPNFLTFLRFGWTIKKHHIQKTESILYSSSEKLGAMIRTFVFFFLVRHIFIPSRTYTSWKSRKIKFHFVAKKKRGSFLF